MFLFIHPGLLKFELPNFTYWVGCPKFKSKSSPHICNIQTIKRGRDAKKMEANYFNGVRREKAKIKPEEILALKIRNSQITLAGISRREIINKLKA